MAAARAPIEFYDILPAPGGCPFAHRAWLALEEKKLPYNHHVIDPNNKPADFQELYRSIVPDPQATGKFPVIVDGDYKMTESMVVVEYLDKAYASQGTKIVPEDAKDLAKAKLWIEVFTDKYQGMMFKAFSATTKAQVNEVLETYAKNLQILDDFLKINGREDGGSFLLGATYSIADLASTPIVRRSIAALPHFRNFNPLEAAKAQGLDRLVRWMQAVVERPSLTATQLTDEQYIQAFAKFVKPLSG